MRSLLISLSLFITLNVQGMNALLVPTAESIDKCLETTGLLLCQDDLESRIRSMSLNARGELVYFLKDKMEGLSNEAIINLYTEFKKLVPVYEELDGCDKWSCRDAKEFLGDVSIEYIKITPVDSDFLIELFKEQPVQSARYGFLSTMHNLSKKYETISEINEVVTFAEFAKEHVRTVGDEYYLYESAVNLVDSMTKKVMLLEPKYEGVYSVTFVDPELNEQIKIDRISVMDSNSNSGLVITMNNSGARLEKFAFYQAGILGNTLFSNEDVYSNQQNFSGTAVKFDLDPESGSISGVFFSERFGTAEFTGSQIVGTRQVSEGTDKLDLNTEDFIGKYDLKVGDIDLTLKVLKRRSDSPKIEGALYNRNVLMNFSKVKYNAGRGVLELVDSKNKRKLVLGVTEVEGKLVLDGVFFNVIMNSITAAQSL
ncbi:hypothetical protein [Halobacteriovorax sp.]|uniref:hypothetical protein n=1 Tax=Halobacteriovorax sp. TaxID=2020862 RepID=UPI003569D056